MGCQQQFPQCFRWKVFLVIGAAIVICGTTPALWLLEEESLRGTIVKLEGNTVPVQEEGCQMKTVR